jgi:hypothetical protein
MRLQDLLCQDGVLQDGLQERVLLQELPRDLLLALSLALAVALPVSDAARLGAELLHHALLKDLMQQGILLHDLACQQRMLQRLLQQRVLLDQLGCGLRVLQRCLQHGVRLEEILREVRVLQDGLQDRVLLQELPRDLLALDAAAHLGAEWLATLEATGGLADQAAELRTAGLQPAKLRAAERTADAAAEEALRLELLLLPVP